MLLTDSHIAIRENIRKFAQERIRPRVFEFESEGGYPEGILSEVGAIGLMGIMAPAEYGGAGLDVTSYALSLMEIAAADGALSTIISIQNMIVCGIVRYGTSDQRDKWLSDLVEGRAIAAFALTEPNAGSDASAIKSRATKSGEGWILNGSKQFISSAQISKLAIVFAVTDPQERKRGISAFLVPTDSPGFRVDKVERKLGQLASDTCAISFSDLPLREESLLGLRGEGYKIALSNLETGRIGIAAQAVGMATAALEITVAYTKERTTMGKPIIEHQAVGFRLADLAAKLEAARQLVLYAAHMKDVGMPCAKEASMAKLFASETAETVVSGALQSLGGYGYIEDFGLAKIYRDVRVCQIYEGTSDIQKMLIARSL